MLNTNVSKLQIAEVAAGTTAERDLSFYSDVESGQHRVYEKDVISQFKANLNQLEDLHGRLRFLMSEVSEVIKKRS